jgi:hypothetical protein
VSLRRILPAIAVLLLALLAGEWATRRWLQTPRSARIDPRFGLVQGPGARFVQSAEGWGEYRADADGFLDRSLPPPGQGVRAVLLGDSFGQGLQVRDRERFTEIAELLMPGLHILNTATAGRSVFHHALLAKRLEDAFAPDLVLVQLDDNKLTDIEIPDDRAGAFAEFDAAPVRERPSRSPAGRMQSLLRRSALVAYLRTRVEKLSRQEGQRLALKLTGRKPDLRDLVAPPGTPRAKFLIDSLVTEIQAVNPHVVLIYVPNINYFESAARVSYPLRRAWFHELAVQRGLPLVDPSDAFLAFYRATGEPLHGFSNTQPGQGHLNARGHAVMANELVTVLRREELVRRTSR